MKSDKKEISTIDIASILGYLVRTPYLSPVEDKPVFLARKMLQISERFRASTKKMNGKIDILFCVYSTEGLEDVIKNVALRKQVLFLPKLTEFAKSSTLQAYFDGWCGLADVWHEKLLSVKTPTKKERFAHSKEFLTVLEKYYIIFKNIFAEHDVKGVFLTGVHGLYETAILLACRENGVKVFCCPHGSCSVINQDKSLLGNVVFFPNSRSEVSMAIRHGIRKENIYITGSPFFDKIAKYRKIEKRNSNKKTIVILTQPLVEDGDMMYDEYFGFIERLLRTISEIGDVKITIKLHPREKYKSKYASIVDSLEIKKAKIVQEPGKDKLYSTLSESDLVIGFESTAEIEAMMLGKNVLTADLRRNSTEYNYKQNVILIKHNEIENKLTADFISKILYVKKIQEQLKKKRDDYIANMFFKIDGKSCQRVAGIIKRTVHGKTAI